MSRFPARLFLLFVIAGTASGSLARAADAPREALEKYLQACVEVDGFSGSVRVSRGNEILLQRGYGLANRELNVPADSATRYRLGSITKQFTGMLILLLQQEGKLSVHDHVKQHLHDAPAAWDDITIHHLLTHTSGLPNFTSFPDYQATMREPSPPLKTIDRFRDKPLDFAPGQHHDYSNSGYVVLGAIIEQVTGQSYGEALAERVFGPLGMNASGYDNTEAIIPNRAAGYSLRDDGIRNCTFLDMSIPHAAGSLYSTVEDLGIWDRALAAGKLLTAESYQAYFRPFQNDYAYGWDVRERWGKPHAGHGGGINGFCTQIDRYPGDDLCVVVLCNLEGLDPGLVARNLAAIVLGQPYETPVVRAEIALDRAALEAYVGEYQMDDGPVITVEPLGEGIGLRGPGGAPARMRAISDNRFFTRIPPSEVTFPRDSEGKVTGIELRMNSQLHTGKPRVKAE